MNSIFIDKLDDLVAQSADRAADVVIVAPYIKKNTIEWLLDVLPIHAKLKILTRATIFDFIMGASDIECWPLIWDRGGIVYLLQTLHAKYYRFDNDVFIGSANITDSALGRNLRSNRELLAKYYFNDELKLIEEALFQDASVADKGLLHDLKPIINRYKKSKTILALHKQEKRLNNRKDEAIVRVRLPDNWFLKAKNPAVLWNVMNSDTNELSEYEIEDAKQDLYILKIPGNIQRLADFKKILGWRLAKHKLVRKLLWLFDHNETENYPYLSYGFIRKELQLKRDTVYGQTDGEVNAFLNWMTYVFEDIFYEVRPQSHSRLLGRKKPV